MITDYVRSAGTYLLSYLPTGYWTSPHQDALLKRMGDAIRDNDVSSMQTLFEDAEDAEFLVRAMCVKKRSPLEMAARQGSDKTLRFMLERLPASANAANFRDINDIPILIWAASAGHYEVVEVLLEYGADVNVTMSHMHTPLMSAARNNHTPVVKLLCENGADVNAADVSGRTALANAFTCFSHPIDPLLVMHLIDAGADLNFPDISGETPLLNGLMGVSNDAMKVLIMNGMDVNARDDGGRTTLRRVAEAGNVEIISCMLEHTDIDVNVRDERGWTALAGAVAQGRLTVVDRLLREPGIDVGVRLFPRRCTPLFYVANHPGPNARLIAERLLDAGADVNARDCYGQTALMQAIRYGMHDVADILRQRGADETAENILGYSAQHMTAVQHPFFMHNMFLDDSAYRNPNFAIASEAG